MGRADLIKKLLLPAVIVIAVAGVGTYFLTRSKAATLVTGSRAPYVCNSPYPTLKEGSTGDCVKYVQWSLNTYFGQAMQIDGNYSVATSDVIKKVPSLSSSLTNGQAGVGFWEVIDSRTATGDNGTLRAACKTFTINGSGTTVSLTAGKEYELSISWKNTGSATWPNTDASFSWNDYGKTPYQSLGRVVTNSKTVRSNDTLTATSKVKFNAGTYTINGTMYDGSAQPGAEGQNTDLPIGPVCTKTVTIK